MTLKDENWTALADVAKELGVEIEDVRVASKQHLKYMKDYRPHRQGGLLFSRRGISRLLREKEKNDIYRDEDFAWAVVCKTLPPNPRRVWIRVPGVDEKCTCNLPMRFAKKLRFPGKRIPVRMVGEGLYQLVIPKWSEHSKEIVL